MDNKKTAQLILAAAITAGVAAIPAHAIAKAKCPVEKCYGIAKKAKNDCGTAKHACAAQATRNGDRSEWMFVMKGNCKRIVGGHLHPPKNKADATK